MRVSILLLPILHGLSSANIVTKESCSTKYGHSSLQHVPSSTTTIHIESTVSEKRCPIVYQTLVPSAETRTVTKTATITNITRQTPVSTVLIETRTCLLLQFLTVRTELDYVCSTTDKSDIVTNTDIRTTKATSIHVSISTVVTGTTHTITKPTPAGFTPVAQEVGYIPKKKRDLSSLKGHSLLKRDTRLQRSSCGTRSTYYHPESVICQKTLETVTTRTYRDQNCVSTRTTILSTQAAAIKTVTVTSTAISTKLTPQVTSTVTVSKHVTTTTTFTKTFTTIITRTSTTTSTAPTVTLYAACAPNNIINHANGNQGIFLVIYGNGEPVPDSATTAYDCCVSCQTIPNCVYSLFFPGVCQLVVAASCDPHDDHGTVFKTTKELPPDEGITVSNGPCGYVQNAGVEY